LWMAPARGHEPLVFELKHSSPRDLKAILDSISKQTPDQPLEVAVEGNRVSVRGGDDETRESVSKLVIDFDVPQVPVFTRFIKLNHASAEKAAEFLNKALNIQPPAEDARVQGAAAAAAAKPDQAEDIPIQIVPATRTNEVFAMGRAEDLKLVESILRAIDTDPPPVFK
jgi:general secretion pathway protein D